MKCAKKLIFPFGTAFILCSSNKEQLQLCITDNVIVFCS